MTGAPCANGRTQDGVALQCADIPLRPGLGATGKRTIRAVVSSADGVVQQMIDVADFRIASFPKPARPAHLRLLRLKGARVVATWRSAPGAKTYVAAIRFTHVRRSIGVVATLRAVRADSVMGPPVVAKLKPARVRLLLLRYAPSFRSFDSGSWTLGARERAWLSRLLPKLQRATSIVCEGHTSPWDGDNPLWLEAVSKERARRVCAYLRGHGFRGPTTSRGWGSSRSRTSNATLDGQYLNARMTIVASDVGRGARNPGATRGAPALATPNFAGWRS